MSLAFVAGQLATADALNALIPLFVTKTSTQSVTSSVAAVNDAELFLDLAAGRTYEVTCVLSAGGAPAGDIKTVWSTTGTITPICVRACFGPTRGTTDVIGAAAAAATVGVNAAVTRTLTTEVDYGVDGSASSAILEKCVVQCTVAGRLQLKWAQRVANATPTTVSSNSYLLAVPVA